MRTSTKNRLVSLLILAVTVSLVVCTLGMSVFAHDSSSSKKSAWDKFIDWFNSDVGQIIGYVVAGIVLVAAVVFVIWWIPKKEKADKKVKKQK